MPFLVVLAITGTLYCFQPQIEPLLYPHRLVVERAPRRGSMPTHCSRAHAPRCRPARRRCPCRSRPRGPQRRIRVPAARRQPRERVREPVRRQRARHAERRNRFMQIDRMLHRKLLLGKTGELLMARRVLDLRDDRHRHRAGWRARGARRAGAAPRPVAARPAAVEEHSRDGRHRSRPARRIHPDRAAVVEPWGKNFKALAATVNLGAPEGAWGAVGSLDAPRCPARPHLPGCRAVRPSPRIRRVDAGDGDGRPAVAANAVGGRQRAVRIRRRRRRRRCRWRAIAIVAGLGVTSGYTLALPSGADGVFTRRTSRTTESRADDLPRPVQRGRAEGHPL